MRIDLQQPPPQVRTLDEAQALIDELWLLLRALAFQNEEQAKLIQRQGEVIEAQAKCIEEQAKRIDALEEKLRTNSRNSSKPPSTDQGKGKPSRRDTGSGRKAGGQPGHEGKARELLPEEEVNYTHHCHPEPRCPCGGTVRTSRLSRRHQVVDLPAIRPVVTEYRLYAGTCEACGRHHEAALPAAASPRLTGPRLLALIGTLTGGYRLSKRLVQGLLADVFRIELSVGAISESEELLGAALEPVVQEAHEYVKHAPVVHADETGHKEKGDGHWMWVAIAGIVSVFLARAARSAAVAQELLGSCFAGILVSDRYAAYGWIAAHRRQVCWAHLLRDFTKMAERRGAAGQIGEELIVHTQQMFAFWRRVRDGTMSRDAFACHMLFLRAQIEKALRRGSACGQARTARTCRHILKVRQALWTFVHTPGVEPTNNLAERTLRSYVIWRKICFGAQSRRGSLYMERMMTVVGSCKLQGRNILDFVTQAVLAHHGSGATPSLIRNAAG
jgi:transposase